MKKITLNVDDLGLSAAVNQAVLQLAQQQRIHSTSFMSLGQISTDEVTELKQQQIEIGLHFDLTGLAQQGSLKNVIFKAFLKQFSPTQLRDLIRKQFDAFEDQIQAVPIFIDGHQHVHQFPQIRELLVQEVKQRYAQKVAFRNTQPFQTDFKAKLIYFLGGATFKKQLQQHQLPFNTAFGGSYDFQANFEQLKSLWENWFMQAPNSGSVIMCHPAITDSNWQDEIKTARECEFAWLSSEEFAQLWQQQQCTAQTWQHLMQT